MLDDGGALLGVITATDIEQRALTRESRDMSAGHLAHTTAALRADDLLESAIRALSRIEDPGLPVLAADGGDELVGWLTHRDTLMAYQHERERLPPSGGEAASLGPLPAGEPVGADEDAAATVDAPP